MVADNYRYKSYLFADLNTWHETTPYLLGDKEARGISADPVNRADGHFIARKV